MNQNKALKLSGILLIILLGIVFFSLNRKNVIYKEYIKDLNQQNQVLKKENELLLLQIGLNFKFREKYYKEKDSINQIISKLNKNIQNKNKELSKIKNKYENLDLDSLLKIATERYEKDININISN
jgi:uncharacterized protein YgiM (DUF1202 family)